MSSRKLLIDTNVFIGLEDEKEVAPAFARLLQLCGQNSIRVFIHEASIADINNDQNQARKQISLSKIKKFEQLSKINLPQTVTLESKFGHLTKSNDIVDVSLLYALDLGVVDFLITQDQGIHTRARRCSPPLADRVLTVADTVAWLYATYEPKAVILPLIEEMPAHAISLTDEIFDSLREGYPDFDQWWRKKCIAEHRQCWVATIDGELAGLVVRKDENHTDAETTNIGPKILKVCTFKVKPKFRGEKLGELLLKQILWFCQKNKYDLVYLTTFPNQIFLTRILEYFGFFMTYQSKTGEHVYEKTLSQARLALANGADLFELARINYPRFVARHPAETFGVPIKGEYHEMLFPEISSKDQGDLFQASGVANSHGTSRTPGNTIRKVYLCRAKTQALKKGSILLFYCSKCPGYDVSQCVTSVGVVESVADAKDLDELVRLTAKRSVYTSDQLKSFGASSDDPVRVIDFLLVGHLDTAIPLIDLLRYKTFNRHAPQSICRLTPERFEPVREKLNFGFEV
jgi:predicted GNAT family N-acyltransferase